jgi:hypothetical protein
MIGYKLTSQKMTTYGGTKWELGVTRTASGKGILCGSGWLHYYSDPLLAILFNPIHANILNPRLFRCEASGKIMDDLCRKAGTTELTLIKEIDVPEITLAQRIAFSILCSKKGYKDSSWNSWADKWLSGEDRSTKSAYAARDAAYAAYAAAATYAAYSAAYAAAAAIAAADTAATYAAAADAACAADYAADAAILDLVSLAQEAMKY